MNRRYFAGCLYKIIASRKPSEKAERLGPVGPRSERSGDCYATVSLDQLPAGLRVLRSRVLGGDKILRLEAVARDRWRLHRERSRWVRYFLALLCLAMIRSLTLS
jgi:hypothetical protein